MFNRFRDEINAIKQRDPAARSAFEILLLYPGFKAIRMHRRANWFFRHNMKLIARFISQRAVRKTGIEIHPGATLGKRVFIDHGTGVVIGETAVVGNDVTIDQGVTLGGTGKDTGNRHPTIGDGCMIGAGAKVLGPFSIGEHSRVAAGAVVLHEIPPYSTAVGVPAKVVKRGNIRITDELDQVHIPDPIAQKLCMLESKIYHLEQQLKEQNHEE